jgi:hypothetical protein
VRIRWITQVGVEWWGTAQNFFMLLRMTWNLKFMNYLFLEFSIYYFQTVINCRLLKPQKAKPWFRKLKSPICKNYCISIKWKKSLIVYITYTHRVFPGLQSVSLPSLLEKLLFPPQTTKHLLLFPDNWARPDSRQKGKEVTDGKSGALFLSGGHSHPTPGTMLTHARGRKM